MTLSLQPGTLCVANGRVVEIDGPSSLSEMLVRDCATGDLPTVPIRRLEPVPKAPKTGADPGFIPKAEWDRCVKLAESLRPFENCARIPTEDLQKIAKKNKLSVRQVQRVRATFQRNPRPSGLVRDPSGRKEGTSLLDPKVDAVVKDVIRKFYFKRERASKESVVRKAKSAVRRLLKVK